MDNTEICTLNRYIPFYDCDYKKRIKLSAILKYAAEIAGYDYTVKGFGHKYLWDNNMVFLLSRVTLKIEEYPLHSEDLTYCTWECGKKGALFLRGVDFISDGKTKISYKSGWVLANPHTRKILRPSAFGQDMPQFMDREITAPELDRIVCENPVKVYDHKVCVSDLDPNKHVYNAVYADICDNALSEEDFERGIDTFRINYIQEATLGDTISIYHSESGNTLGILGKVEDKVCFEAEYVFR